MQTSSSGGSWSSRSASSRVVMSAPALARLQVHDRAGRAVEPRPRRRVGDGLDRDRGGTAAAVALGPRADLQVAPLDQPPLLRLAQPVPARQPEPAALRGHHTASVRSTSRLLTVASSCSSRPTTALRWLLV